jgi:hypothetical protein
MGATMSAKFELRKPVTDSYGEKAYVWECVEGQTRYMGSHVTPGTTIQIAAWYFWLYYRERQTVTRVL